jgi:hypothetical protein
MLVFSFGFDFSADRFDCDNIVVHDRFGDMFDWFFRWGVSMSAMNCSWNDLGLCFRNHMRTAMAIPFIASRYSRRGRSESSYCVDAIFLLGSRHALC